MDFFLNSMSLNVVVSEDCLFFLITHLTQSLTKVFVSGI